MTPTLEFAPLLGPSRALCEEFGISFDAAVPPFVRDNLRRICDELGDGHTRPERHGTIAYYIQSRLESRVHLHALLRRHPEILEEPIEAPVFIVGLNRTGTTFLHRALIATGRFDAPTFEDQNVLPTAELMAAGLNGVVGGDADVGASVAEALAAHHVAVEANMDEFAGSYEGMHDFDLALPEEDMCAHAHAFASLGEDILFGLPNYRKWLDEQPLDEGYADHRVWMQTISWRRRRAGKPLHTLHTRR